MAVQVNPITQSLPATTAIQDPATRRFAQAVEDALRALRSEEGAVESLKKAADAMNGAIAGGTPPSIAQWLFSSELYQKLTSEIARVDTQAKQDLLAESMARSAAIAEIQAALAEIESTPAYDPATTYQVGDLVTYDNKLYRAKGATTGNLPTNTTYWDKVGDYASLGDVVAAHTLQISEIESDITEVNGGLTSEITARQALAAQMRGTYTGTDIAMVSQGLVYSERQARAAADGALASSLDALTARTGSAETAIVAEQTLRASNDLAIVSAVNTALAQITGVSTSISQSGENLIANWTTAQADKWSQIESEVLTSGGQTIRAALQQEATTRANADGSLGAQWTLKTDINGYISGFGFASTANNATPTSAFIINADRFVMTMPGYGNHVPFAIGPSGASFVGAQNTGGVAQPFEGWSLGSQSLVTVSDGKVGGSALRLVAGLGYPTQTAFVPIDPTKKYRVRFWARPSSTCDGLLYFSLRQAINETGTWGPTNGGRAPYKPRAQTRATHNATYGTDAWGEYSYIWDAADWQADVKFFRPEFLDNYSGTAGYWEVQGLVVEEATDVEAAKDAANAAQTAANNANSTLADIAADNKLTPAEKKSVRVEWDAIYAERASIRSQADAFSITTEKTNYDNAFQALGTYLNAGAAYAIGATPPWWIADANLAVTTNIVGTTFRTNWATLYQRKQELLNKISAEAAKRADWSNVTNKTGFASISQITPSNVTTYIDNAAIGNAQIGGDIWSSNFVAGSAGWRIYRSGSAEFRNVTVRGDVEASSLKANTAMIDRAHLKDAVVDTLQLAGNAVTIPIAAAGTTSCQTATTSFEGAPTAVVLAAVAHFHVQGTNVLGTLIAGYVSLYRGATLLKQIKILDTIHSSDGAAYTAIVSGSWVISDSPGGTSTYYRAVLTISGGNSTVLTTSSCSVLALGVKR